MKKYKVYDLCEWKEVIGFADTLREVRQIARERYNDTDGECAIYYAELNPETLKYKFTERKFLATI